MLPDEYSDTIITKTNTDQKPDILKQYYNGNITLVQLHEMALGHNIITGKIPNLAWMGDFVKETPEPNPTEISDNQKEEILNGLFD